MKKWEIVKSSVVHKNKYFSVVVEKFRLSSGGFGKYYLLKSPDFVAVIAVQNEFTYFVEMDRYALRKRILEFPMGAVEKGETPLIAARRELKEETGITAKKIKQIGCLDTSKGRSDQKGYIYIAEGLSFGEQDLDIVERESDAKVVKLKISEVSELIRKGKITDSYTIASFQLFMLNYKNKESNKS
jgi:8-oxo-dGTP pyrophosphatase MutT (NUDIX family)